jgi:hypothetical protein
MELSRVGIKGAARFLLTNRESCKIYMDGLIDSLPLHCNGR